MRWLVGTLAGLLAALLAAVLYVCAIVAIAVVPAVLGGTGSGGVAVNINGFLLIGMMTAGWAAGFAWYVRRRA